MKDGSWMEEDVGNVRGWEKCIDGKIGGWKENVIDIGSVIKLLSE